jgi:exportin-2 (importin alpha re-exporter)
MIDIINSNNIEGILGIFQELLSSKAHENQSFQILNQLYIYNTLNNLINYMPIIFDLLLKRMKQQMKDTKTPKYCRLFIHSLCLFTVCFGSQNLLLIFNKLDSNLINELITHVWLPNCSFTSLLTSNEILQILVGTTNLLCDINNTNNINQNLEIWGRLVKCIIPLLEAKGMQKIELFDDNFIVKDDDDAAEDREFDTKYSKLTYATYPDKISKLTSSLSSSFVEKY